LLSLKHISHKGSASIKFSMWCFISREKKVLKFVISFQKQKLYLCSLQYLFNNVFGVNGVTLAPQIPRHDLDMQKRPIYILLYSY